MNQDMVNGFVMMMLLFIMFKLHQIHRMLK